MLDPLTLRVDVPVERGVTTPQMVVQPGHLYLPFDTTLREYLIHRGSREPGVRGIVSSLLAQGRAKDTWAKELPARRRGRSLPRPGLVTMGTRRLHLAAAQIPEE